MPIAEHSVKVLGINALFHDPAAALVVEALRRFKAAGAAHVTLDVNANNPSAARVYTWLGFEIVGRRARYVRDA